MKETTPRKVLIDLSEVPGWEDGDLEVAARFIYQQLLRPREDESTGDDQPE